MYGRPIGVINELYTPVEHGKKQRICVIAPVTKTEELVSERGKFLVKKF